MTEILRGLPAPTPNLLPAFDWLGTPLPWISCCNYALLLALAHPFAGVFLVGLGLLGIAPATREPPLFIGAGPMPWFVKLEEGIVAKQQFDAVLPAHLAWLEGLASTGHQPRSGYWADRKGLNGDGAGGMLLFWAGDWAEAQLLINNDPLIRQGCVRWTLHEWSLVFGDFGPGSPRSG